MQEEYFFEIPIYRTSEEDFYSEYRQNLNNFLNELRENHGDDYVEGREQKLEVRYEKHNRNNWRYSDMIGGIRLFILGNQIRAEVTKITAKRIARGFKYNHYDPPQKLFETYFYATDQNIDIYNRILEALRSFENLKGLKNRHVDLEVFEKIGPYIDYRSFIQDSRS